MASSTMEAGAGRFVDVRFFRKRPPAKEATATVRLGKHQQWMQRIRPLGEPVRVEVPRDRSLTLEIEFRRLTNDWQAATKYQSSVTAICSHPSYQRIIGMGRSALPFILRDLERSPHLWFWALKAITGIDPVPSDHRGKIALMASDWIAWGRQRGLCAS